MTELGFRPRKYDIKACALNHYVILPPICYLGVESISSWFFSVGVPSLSVYSLLQTS